ncbi:MAG: histidine--tRNA ligase [Planctomycetota bacterium]
MANPVYRAPRGLRDVLPEQVGAWRWLESEAARLARLFGYREIRPPLLEETELFRRSVGEVTDIVEKEMFTLERADHSFTLRPEGTAGVVRAYLEAGYAKNAPLQKLWYCGPMFRYERPQKGRERQFTQFGVECIGSLDPRLDAETIALAVAYFERLGLEGLEVRVNSMGDGGDRDAYRDAVREFVRPNLAKYSEDSQRRFERNVLRVLDSKDARDVELNRGAPKILDHLSPENRAHFDRVIALLRELGVDVVVDPGVVRGLDYYTRTIFEVHCPSLGARSALCGGGRYDHLVEQLGGPDLGAVGFAIGFTGTLTALEEAGKLAAHTTPPPECFVASADETSHDAAFSIAHELRAAGVSAVFEPDDRKLKAQLKVAARTGSPVVAVVGSTELEQGTVQLKDMARAQQEAVPRAELAARVRALLEDAAASAR